MLSWTLQKKKRYGRSRDFMIIELHCRRNRYWSVYTENIKLDTTEEEEDAAGISGGVSSMIGYTENFIAEFVCKGSTTKGVNQRSKYI